MWPVTSPLWARVSPDDDLSVGDVAVFLGVNGRIWFHRVVATSDAGVQTRGDTNAKADAPVPKSAVLGRVSAVAWGPLQVPLPRSGPSAPVIRRLGLLWGRVAPPLRPLIDRIARV